MHHHVHVISFFSREGPGERTELGHLGVASGLRAKKAHTQKEEEEGKKKWAAGI